MLAAVSHVVAQIPAHEELLRFRRLWRLIRLLFFLSHWISLLRLSHFAVSLFLSLCLSLSLFESGHVPPAPPGVYAPEEHRRIFGMELVTCIAGKIFDYSVEPIKRQVDYIIHSKSNLEKLEIELNDLKDNRRTIEERIAEATSKGGRILEQVEKWVKEVDEVTGKANQLNDESRAANLNCVNGCSFNLRMRRQLSKQSIQLMKDIARLFCTKEFPEVSSGYHREEVCGISTGDYLPFDSRESAVEEVMVELKNPNTVRIGVCGIGGVGKTTLVKQVFRKAKQDTSLFEKVAILFDVKSIPDLEGIQKQIVEKLEMGMVEGETIVTRGGRLCAYINGKRILIILDDVQTKIDLEQLGVPGVATCKILLTSRIPISGMSTDKGFKLGILPEEEAWELFENKADVLHKDPAIKTVAKQVAKKCGGLPVLIVTVASSLKDRKIPPLWEEALRRLKEFDHKSSEKEARSTIEWSYNQLDDSMLKDLFLLCGTTVRGNRICLEDLFKYSMGLSLFKNVHTVEEARNKFYSKVEELKDFCLLLDGEDDTSVRMHDIVRDAARHIALRDHHMLSAVEDGGDDQSDGKGWPNKELTEKCTTISFPSANNIPEVLQCPALKMLLLQGYPRYRDSLKNWPRFFEEMKQLRVLSLKPMGFEPSLPSSLQFLNNLQTLCLHDCFVGDISLVGQLNNLEILSLERSHFKLLPKEIGQLTRLRLLDLTNCYDLEVISPGVISSLTKLEELRMRESFKNWKAAGDGSNAGLFELKHLSKLTALEVHVPDANILPADFLSHELKRFQIVIGGGRYLWDNKYDRTLNTLKLKLTTTSIELERGLKKLLKICDDLSLDGTESVNHIVRQLDNQGCPQVRHLLVRNNADFEYIRNKDVCTFMYITTLKVDGCDRLSFLFSFSMAKSLEKLTHLKIFNCEIMEVIVECSQENMDNMFPKLEDLMLYSLPKLTRFCSNPGMLVSHWPLLKTLEVIDCGQVKNFAAENHQLNPQTQQSLFLIDKSSFRNLEHLELDDMNVFGPPPAELVFGKLKYIGFGGGRAPSVLVLAKLIPNLESIQVWGGIFGGNSSSSSSSCAEIDAVGSGTHPHVRQLRLFGPSGNVLHLGNSQSAAGPPFPNLQILEVVSCDMLKNVESSTISFQNLTTLTVESCDGLEYLTSYSVAKNLVQLTKLEVSDCKSIVAIVQTSNIVGDDDDDDDDAAANEIHFNRLQHLQLTDLPRLQGFCSGNCIVKFPPSVTLYLRNCPIDLNISHGVLLTDKVDQEDDNKQKEVDDNDDNEQAVLK